MTTDQAKLYKLQAFSDKQVQASFEVRRCPGVSDPVKHLAGSLIHVTCLTINPSTKEKKMFGWGSNNFFELGQESPQAFDETVEIDLPPQLVHKAFK